MDRDLIEKIKIANDIVDIVGEKVALRRAGARFKGLSPFNNEKTPSFFVNPDLQIFHCFSTNQGGDVVKFVMLTRGMSFPEAVEFLAKRAGIRVEQKPLSPQEQKMREQNEQKEKVLFKINRFAAHFFQTQFWEQEGEGAREYAQRRGLDRKTLEAFGIGFAPDSWSKLRDYFVSIKAPLVDATKLGLLRAKNEETPRSDGANLYDFYRNRLMFPIRNHEGEVIGFGGRALGGDDGVKYINSPESPIFDKGRSLYNLDRARKYIREADTVILVEGYMDCIALDKAGIQNVVANLGTALTPQHVQLLTKLASKVVCLYDSDEAGQRALERNMDLFLEYAGWPLLGTHVASGKDPDEFLREGGEEAVKRLRAIIAEAPAWIDQWIARVVSQTAPNLQARAQSLEKIAEKLGFLKEDLWIKARIPGLSASLGFREELIFEAVQSRRKARSVPAVAKSNLDSPKKNLTIYAQQAQKAQQNKGVNGKKVLGFEWQFLQDLVRYTNWIPQLREQYNKDPQLIQAVAVPEIARAIQYLAAPLENGQTDEARLQAFVASLREEKGFASFITSAAVRRGEPVPEGLFRDAMQRLQLQHTRRLRSELREQIKAAEALGDAKACDELQAKLSSVIRAAKLGDKE